MRKILLFPEALIDQLDFHAVVQKRQFAQPARQNVEVVFDHPKGLRAGQEVHLGAAPFVLPVTLSGATGTPCRNSMKWLFPSRRMLRRSHSESA